MSILIVFYALLPAGQLIVYLATRQALDPANTLNFAASILCLHWMLAQTLLAAKIPVLQRLLPYDARIRFHVLASVGILVTLVYHGVYKIAAGKEIDLVSWALLGVFTLMLVLALLWVPFFRRGIQRQALSYDRSKSLHGWLQLALTALLFFHIAGSGFFDDLPVASAVLCYALFVGATVAFLLSKFGLFHLGATVVDAHQSEGIVTVRMIPDRRPRYRSGQFAFLKSGGPAGWKEDHPFSFLSNPQDPLVSFAVRARGDFTRGLASLRPGDRVKVNGGFGNFRPGAEPGICFVSTGIGMVPFLSVLKDLRDSGDPRPIHFHLAVNHEDEVPERERLEDLAAGMPNLNLKVLVKPSGHQRFSREYFHREVGDVKSFTYYLCSSAKVRAEVFRALRSLGVARASIRWEAFELG